VIQNFQILRGLSQLKKNIQRGGAWGGGVMPRWSSEATWLVGSFPRVLRHSPFFHGRPRPGGNFTEQTLLPLTLLYIVCGTAQPCERGKRGRQKPSSAAPPPTTALAGHRSREVTLLATTFYASSSVCWVVDGWIESWRRCRLSRFSPPRACCARGRRVVPYAVWVFSWFCLVIIELVRLFCLFSSAQIQPCWGFRWRGLSC
jgi:hypothetical protein